MRELQPINQQVLLEPEEDKSEQKTASGIILPGTVSEKQKVARVVALSKIDNAEINTGDLVLYKEFAGTLIEFEGKKYRLIPYSDIISKIVETDTI